MGELVAHFLDFLLVVHVLQPQLVLVIQRQLLYLIPKRLDAPRPFLQVRLGDQNFLRKVRGFTVPTALRVLELHRAKRGAFLMDQGGGERPKN